MIATILCVHEYGAVFHCVHADHCPLMHIACGAFCNLEHRVCQVQFVLGCLSKKYLALFFKVVRDGRLSNPYLIFCRCFNVLDLLSREPDRILDRLAAEFSLSYQLIDRNLTSVCFCQFSCCIRDFIDL